MKITMVALMSLIPGLYLESKMRGPFDSRYRQPVQDRANAPVITNLKFEPSAAPQGSPIMLRIQVFDRQGREDIIPILHLLREGIELLTTRLYDDGSHGDSVPRDGFYAGRMTIPLTASPGNHWFVVFLYDKGGHRSNLLLYEFWVSGDQQVT